MDTRCLGARRGEAGRGSTWQNGAEPGDSTLDDARRDDARRDDAKPRDDAQRDPAMSAPLLVVDNISKRFRGLHAVDRVSFSVPRGAIIGLIGPNGAGKTTTFNMIAGVF